MNRFNSMKVPNPFAKTWNTRSLAKYLKQNFPYKDFFPRSLKDIYDKININNHVHSTENIELVIRALWNRPGALEALLAKYYELDTDPDSVSQHLNAHGLRDNSGDLWTAGSVESAMIEAKPPEK
ncbi:hypothetical protein [Endozoicomonas numazuensis]|nr:hypothetical protein [Endozoicomonas numazuensis]